MYPQSRSVCPFCSYTRPGSQRPLSQTSGRSLGRTTYVHPVPNRDFLIPCLLQKRHSPQPRAFYWHETSIIVSRPGFPLFPADVPRFATGYPLDNRTTSRCSRRHPYFSTIRFQCALGPTFRFTFFPFFFSHYWAYNQRVPCHLFTMLFTICY